MPCCNLSGMEFSGCGYVGHRTEPIHTYETQPFRTVSEICIRADENPDAYLTLLKLLEDIERDKLRYKKYEVEFMVEHIRHYLSIFAAKQFVNSVWE